MIVPDHWAEARIQRREGGRQVTVRRFGWSEFSMQDAELMAHQRAEAALQQALSGHPLSRREPKRAYNGAEGVPIREEVLKRCGPEVISRNSYGAHCLNSPRVLFADVDFDLSMPRSWLLGVWGLAFALCLVGGNLTQRWALCIAALVFGGLMLVWLTQKAHAAYARREGAAEAARGRLNTFLRGHPEWRVRTYKTPAGLRYLVVHACFSPLSDKVAKFFQAVGADPLYVRMCQRQRCFRARLTGKPWRMGIEHRLRPRPGIWPVASERLALRQRWVDVYERTAERFSACHFVEEQGEGRTTSELEEVVRLHDEACRALRFDLPLA
ncbi:hypothetical protein [Ideonella sp.]|jgi:hypothetical protein|uniref:hypothetical protein n=1 Tax=Ideonella sp. TaxID=1929293 RepID=UPI0037BE8E53